MKRYACYVSVFLILLMICGVNAHVALASVIYSEGYFKYTIKDEAVCICGYIGNEEEVTVPSMIAGKPVSEISTSAFVNASSVKKINLPDTIMTIEPDSIAAGIEIVYNSNKDNGQVSELDDNDPLVTDDTKPSTNDTAKPQVLDDLQTQEPDTTIPPIQYTPGENDTPSQEDDGNAQDNNGTKGAVSEIEVGDKPTILDEDLKTREDIDEEKNIDNQIVTNNDKNTKNENNENENNEEDEEGSNTKFILYILLVFVVISIGITVIIRVKRKK